MKKRILTETARTPVGKMCEVNAGASNQNWGACSERQLREYYRICLENNLIVARNQVEAEIKNRSHHEWLVPRPFNVDQFTVPNAQYLWNERNTCHRIIQTALDLPYTVGDTQRPSEYLLRAYMLIKCMGHESDFKMLEIWIKNHMKDQPYYDLIPHIADQVLNMNNVADDIAQAVRNVNYN